MDRERWSKLIAAALLFALAVLPAGSLLHGHDEDGQNVDHCAVCHVRHLTVIATDGVPLASTPDVVEHPIVGELSQDELDTTHRIHPTRGPPA